MDSFFLAEMFKYLFLLFAEPQDLPFDVEDYIFTTEAHLLPLSLSTAPLSSAAASNRTVTTASLLVRRRSLISGSDGLCPPGKVGGGARRLQL